MPSENVTVAKPKIGGAIQIAPIGTELATDATSLLNVAFKKLGYCSEDGLTNGTDRSSSDVKAWGGDVVMTSQTDFKDTFKFTLIEATDIEVLKYVFGATNVTGTLSTGITIKVNSKELSEHVLAVDMILRNGTLKRIIVPHAKIIEISEVTYNDTDPVAYEVSVAAFPDTEGNTHYEYIKGE